MFQNMENVEELKTKLNEVKDWFKAKNTDNFSVAACSNNSVYITRFGNIIAIGAFYVSAGTYTCSVAVSSNYFIPLLYTTETNIKKIFPKINLSNGQNIRLGNITTAEGGNGSLFLAKQSGNYYLITNCNALYSATQNASKTITALTFQGLVSPVFSNNVFDMMDDFPTIP